MCPTPLTIHTLGHSHRSMQELVALLRAAGIQTLVDVRSFPGSRRYPHFSGENLRMALEGAGMVYHWAGRQLGGKRTGQAVSAHTALSSDELRAYADHMETEVFRKGIQHLMQLAGKTRLAILCAEKMPQDCHRALLGDYLQQLGVSVRHIIDGASTLEHTLNPRARWKAPYLIYDQPRQGSLTLDS
jgi:uncharacterized protein (DUF488 family)